VVREGAEGGGGGGGGLFQRAGQVCISHARGGPEGMGRSSQCNNPCTDVVAAGGMRLT